MKDFILSEETLGYVTSPDESNTDKRFLVAGSQNVLVDYQKKVKTRSGYTRLGAANTSLTEIRSAYSWNTSTNTKLPLRFYDDELEVYLGTVDSTSIAAWTRVLSGWSTTAKMRFTTWWDDTEKKDLLLMVVGDDNIYEWTGAVAVVSSVTANTITKAGTNTFAQSRFYTARDMTLINVRTGTEFAYTGGTDTTTLTGVTGSPVTDGMVAGDILVQKIVTRTNNPSADRNNDTIFQLNNQIAVGSDDDNLVYISANDDITDFTPSSPRLPGEGALLTLDSPATGFASIGQQLLIFSGKSSLYVTEYQQLDVGGTLTETLNVRKLDIGVNQGAKNQEGIVQISNQIAYISNEPALRIISNPEDLTGINPETFSNPIKPDFDAEDWDNVHGIWYKNMLIFSTPDASHLYMLNFVEDADGKVKRFWNPPQILPVGPMSLIDLDDGNGYQLYGHSNAVPETYLLFDGASDGQYSNMAVTDKLPINAIAKFAYNNYKKKGILKNFDEYFVEGEITNNTTDLLMTLDYDYGGATQTTEKTIDGSDEDILEGNIGFNSLAQQSLAVNPMGGLLNPPSDARRFRVVFESPKEDFFEIQTTFSSNDVDLYWAIITHGANAEISRRKAINIRK